MRARGIGTEPHGPRACWLRPRKPVGLEGYGLPIVDRVPIAVPRCKEHLRDRCTTQQQLWPSADVRGLPRLIREQQTCRCEGKTDAGEQEACMSKGTIRRLFEHRGFGFIQAESAARVRHRNRHDIERAWPMTCPWVSVPPDMEGCQEERSIRPDSPALALSPGDAKPGHRRIAGRQLGEAPGEYSVSIIARMAACQEGRER